MKITITEGDSPQLDYFPRLMQSMDTGNIVLAKNTEEATIIFSKGKDRIGEFRKIDIASFQDFNGTIELSNE